MRFKDIYFKEDKESQNNKKKEIFLERFKNTYLKRNEIEFSSEDNQLDSDEWNQLSIELNNCDTVISWKKDAEYSNNGVESMKTGAIEEIIRFSIRKMFENPEENYTPEDFFDRQFLINLKPEILGMLRNSVKLNFKENILPPKDARDSGEWGARSAEAGLYSPAFYDFYDVVEKKYSLRKRELDYTSDYFIVVKGKGRK